jgi:hypothetical protein
MLAEVSQHQDAAGLNVAGLADMSGAIANSNPDVISCGGGGESQRTRPQHLSSKTLRGAFVKRYNALSKRSAKNKSQRRPGLQQVFDNAAFHRDHVWGACSVADGKHHPGCFRLLVKKTGRVASNMVSIIKMRNTIQKLAIVRSVWLYLCVMLFFVWCKTIHMMLRGEE